LVKEREEKIKKGLKEERRSGGGTQKEEEEISEKSQR